MKGNFRLAKGVLGQGRQKLLDPEYDCNLNSVPVDVSKEEFQFERQRLLNFIAGSERQEDIMDNGPLKLLRFIQKFNLGICVPNIVLMLRSFLTTGISVASCERSLS